MRAKPKVNVLMVDDQPGKLLTYEAILSELGETLISARSGNEALEILLKNDIAVVLTDVSMPGMDGFELADIIRRHPRFQQLAILFISAVCLTDLDRLKGYQRGAVDYISVPIIPELLRAKVSVFAELYRRTRQMEALNRELRSLSHSLIVAQDNERRRIARALHDGLGQELTAAKMVVDSLLGEDEPANSSKRLATVDLSEMILRAIQQVRSISHLLHPPLLDEVGLASAIRWLLEGFTKRSGIITDFDLCPPDFPRLLPELETALFRIVQEAVNNVYRHSAARHCWVTLRRSSGLLIVTVRDDGKGISSAMAEGRDDHIGVGIGGMRQRVKEFGGHSRIDNCLPGTLVEITIPTGPELYQHGTATPTANKAALEDSASPPRPVPVPVPAQSAARVTQLSVSAPSHDAADRSQPRLL